MSEIGKLIAVAGVAMVVVGVAIWGLGRAGFRGLPGDVNYQSDHVKVFFPVVTCIAVSILLTLLMWLWNWLHRGP